MVLVLALCGVYNNVEEGERRVNEGNVAACE